LTDFAENADIIIIGGGIAGAGLAAEASQSADVILLEAEEAFGYHATGRSAAMFEPNYGNEVIRYVTRASRSAFEEIGALSPRGVMILADENRRHLMPEANSSDISELGIEDAVALVPILNSSTAVSAVLLTSACDIDVDMVFQAYLRRARKNGAKLFNRSRVERIERINAGWRVSAGGRDFRAPVIVNAAGAWADQVARMAGVSPFGIQPFRRSVARLPAPGGHDVKDWPMLLSVTEDWYAKPDAGKWLVSPAEEDPVEAMDAWADDMVLAEGLARYQDFVTEEVTRVESSWAGLRSFAPDRTPVVGFAPNVEGFFWLAGQGGYGVQTSPAMSAFAADLLTGRDSGFDANIIVGLSPERRN